MLPGGVRGVVIGRDSILQGMDCGQKKGGSRDCSGSRMDVGGGAPVSTSVNRVRWWEPFQYRRASDPSNASRAAEQPRSHADRRLSGCSGCDYDAR